MAAERFLALGLLSFIACGGQGSVPGAGSPEPGPHTGGDSGSVTVGADGGSGGPEGASPPGDAATLEGASDDGAAQGDFSARCHAPGVLVCVGFDSASDLSPAKWPASGIYAAGDGVFRGTFDTAVAASGAGSLKFTVPSNGSANSSGYWRQLIGQNFGANGTFYVQFRQRFSPEFLTNKWPVVGGGQTFWKQEIFSNDQSTCGQVEITTVNGWNRGFPQMYSACGADGFAVDLGNGDYLLEQGDTASTGYNCHYQHPTASTCFMYPSNIWVTFYYRVSIGTFGQPDSTIEAWAALPGQPYVEWINMQNHTLHEDTAGQDYDMVTLLPYMTGRDSSVSAGPTAYTWYDELIVSTLPIAVP